MFENEIWVRIPEFSKYLVSNHGRIKHIDRIEPRKLEVNSRGFVVVVLFGNDAKVRYVRSVAKLVAESFVDRSRVHDVSLTHVEGVNYQTHVWHIDGDFKNCRADNLEWATKSAVMEWNEMHRTGVPKLKTPRVRNNRTGAVYENAFECGMAEGETEGKIVWRIEVQADGMYDEAARYCYL